MANIYSDVLYEGNADTSGEAFLITPAGYVYVVRDLTGWPPDEVINPPGDIIFRSYPTAVPWAGWVSPYVQTRRFYHWVGRQVFPEGTGWSADTTALGSDPWQIRVCGYRLTLP